MVKDIKDKLIFENINVFGISNPMLILTGKFYDSDSKLVFKINNKIINPDYSYIDKNNAFCYHLKFNSNDKRICLYLENNYNIEPIYEIKTNSFKRGINKILEASRRKTANREIKYYNPLNIIDYNKWLLENKKGNENLIFGYNPLISVILYVDINNIELLNNSILSIKNQTYKNWELIIINSSSQNNFNNKIIKVIRNVSDNKINLFKNDFNKNYSSICNENFEKCNGDFIALIDTGDILDKNTFSEAVKLINNNSSIDFIYSDEDEINSLGKNCNPDFKPDFSPDLLLGKNYINHHILIRKSIIDKVGGFQANLDAEQNYDLILKISEKTNNIFHISKVLYHHKTRNLNKLESRKDQNIRKLIIKNALNRRNKKAEILTDSISNDFILNYKYENEPLISIIIPTKDLADTLNVCLESIYKKTDYNNFEVIVANNNSKEKETFNLFDKYKAEHKNFKVIDVNIPFNYSKINNIISRSARGEYLLFLNNDTEIISKDYLKYMVGYAMQEHIGAVGVKLLFPDNTIQHGGVILGINGIAAHAYQGYQKDYIGHESRLRIPSDYGAVTAACLMISKNKFNEVNKFDESLKVNFNDVDLNIKLLSKGYYNVLLPQVELYHFESKSRGIDDNPEKHKNFENECNIITNKWKKYLQHDPFYNDNYSLKKPFYLERKK